MTTWYTIVNVEVAGLTHNDEYPRFSIESMSIAVDVAKDAYVRRWKMRKREKMVCAARGSGVKVRFLDTPCQRYSADKRNNTTHSS